MSPKIISLIKRTGILLMLCLTGTIAHGANYYVDSVAGSDANAGTSSTVPWKTFTNVNSRTFTPGEQILLKAGSNFTTGMDLKGDGTSGSYIVVTSYGTGARPRFTSISPSAIKLTNGSYWSISGLDFFDCNFGVNCDYTETNNVGLRISNLYAESSTSAGSKTVKIGCSADGTSDPTKWMIKDVDVAGVIAINQNLIGLDGVYFANIFTVSRPWNMQDIVVRSCFGAGSSTTTAIAVHNCTNATIQDVSLTNNMTAYAPQGTTSIFIASTKNLRFYNNYIADTQDTNSYDMSGADSECYNDGLTFRGCAFDHNAGAGVEFLALSGRAGDYNKNNSVDSCAFQDNGHDTNMGYDADMYFANQTGLSSANYSGSSSNNIYYNAYGFTQGSAGTGWTFSNNRTVQLANLALAAGDYATTQGPVWYYTYFNGSTWQNLTYNSATARWGDYTTGAITSHLSHPGNNSSYWTAREWHAPADGNVHIRGWVLKNSTDSAGDGVRVRITKNGTKIWPAGSYQTIAATDRIGVSTNIDDLNVTSGDIVRFEINYGTGNNNFDWTSWTPAIAYQGASVFSDNFNANATDAAPSGWFAGGPDTALSPKVKEVPSSSNKSVLMTDNSTTGEAWMVKTFTGQSSNFTLSYSFYQPLEHNWFRVSLKNNTSGVIGPKLFTVSGNLVYRNQSNVDIVVAAVAAGSWHTVTLAIDPAAKTYDITLDGTLQVSDAPFNDNVTTLDAVGFGSGVSTSGKSTYVDEVSATTP